MFWQKKKDEDPKELRERAIKDFRNAFFSSARRPNNDDSLYEIPFVHGGSSNVLRIYLPNDFPIASPVFQVVGPMNHSWLDQFKRVIGCNVLNSWTRSSSLAHTTEVIINTFEAQAIVAGQQPPASLGLGLPSATNFNASSYISAGYTQQQGLQPQLPPLSQQPHYSSDSHASGLVSGAGGYTQQATARTSAMILPPSYAQYQQQPAQAQVSSQGQAQGFLHAQAHYVDNMAVATRQQQQQMTPLRTHPSVGQSMSLSPPNTAPTSSSSSGRRNGGDNSPSAKIPMPEIPNSFPELRALSEEQLELMMSDHDTFQTFLQSLKPVDAMRRLREELRVSNLKQAEATLQMREAAEEARAEALSLQAMLREAVDKHRQKVEQARKKFAISYPDVLRRLYQLRESLDKESEDLAERFVSGKHCSVGGRSSNSVGGASSSDVGGGVQQLSLDAFIEAYLEVRKKYHTLNCQLAIATRK